MPQYVLGFVVPSRVGAEQDAPGLQGFGEFRQQLRAAPSNSHPRASAEKRVLDPLVSPAHE